MHASVPGELACVLLFWGIDAYFLCQERQFRSLYEDVRSTSKSEIDHSMDVCRWLAIRSYVYPHHL